MPSQIDKKMPQCDYHWYKQKAFQHFREAPHYSDDTWKYLKQKMEDQKHLCPYTGELLIEGENASLEHVLPVSRFPEHRYDLDNVEWVSWKVNDAKRNLTKDEFLALVHLIHNHTN